MSTKDSTGDKLISSIRKTKSDTVTNTTQKRVVKKRVVKKAEAEPMNDPGSAKNAKTRSGNNKKELVDLFQSGRRVWPD